MISKRNFMLGFAAFAVMPSSRVLAHTQPFKLSPKFEPQSVAFSGYAPGTVIVDPRNHFLYLQLSGGMARRYGVGVGKAGLAFKGTANIARKAKWPSWTPTKNMIRRQPGKYAKYAKGVPGARATRSDRVRSISTETVATPTTASTARHNRPPSGARFPTVVFA